jgi:hypothetical protein
VVAIGLVLAGLLVAEQAADLLHLALPKATRIGCWLLATILIARAVGERRYLGLFKTVRTTTFGYWDTAAYTPLCLLLGISVIAVAS